jgi:serine/threonine protein kinase
VLVNDNLEASLTDFGISHILQRASSFTAFDMPGSFEEITTPTTLRGWRWKARELMMSSDENGRYISGASKAIDVWAFAMTVIEVRTFLLSSFPDSHRLDLYWTHTFLVHQE